MSKERPAQSSAVPTPLPVFNPDGTLNAGNLAKQYGLGMAEASQVVSFGQRSGTVAEMLGDAKCPVGGLLRGAYSESGLAGVEKQFGLLKQMDPGFEVVISEETRAEVEQSKKKSNQSRPGTQLTT